MDNLTKASKQPENSAIKPKTAQNGSNKLMIRPIRLTTTRDGLKWQSRNGTPYTAPTAPIEEKHHNMKKSIEVGWIRAT